LSTETLAFLFTDIEGSTALLQRIGDEVYSGLLADHHEIIRSGLAAYAGREVGTAGDGVFAVFSSPRACVAAVVEIQRSLVAHEWPARAEVRVRMGVHVGEASETDLVGFAGLEVHRAARVAAVAHGGQVVLSAAATALVHDALPAGVTLRDLGLHRLKDLGRPEHIFQVQADGLREDFPPLRSLDNPALPNNLPVQLSAFIGREHELSELRRLVESSRLVTLTGPGGSGKTRLALQVVAELLDGSGDGVWLVELAAVSDEGAVPQAVAQALGITSRPAQPALETLIDALTPQRILILLDNCEHLIGACAKLADAVLRRCPGAHLVTTSREPLGIGGETIYRVPSLSLPATADDGWAMMEGSDAVALFVERARSQGVGLATDKETSDLVVSTCRRLDGMPLAIELAAARLRSLSIRDLHGLLDQRFRLLTGGSRSALERQQTLRATVDWSYSLLNDPERSLLRRLSVFSDGFDLQAAGAVCAFGEIQDFDVTDILGSLVDQSLVVAEPSEGGFRYRLLETIRQFAAERFVEADRDEVAFVVDAHCEHFLAVAETAARECTGPTQAWWFARLKADNSNLRRAIEHAAGDTEKTALVLRFAIALKYYWWAFSLRQEAFGLLAPVLERPEAIAFPKLLARALATAALMARYVDVRRSVQFGEQSVTLARELSDDRLLVESLTVLSAACSFAGDFGKGIPFGEESVERARELGDDFLLAESLNAYLLCNQATDPDRTGPDRTEELYSEAIACSERHGNPFLTGLLQNNAGCFALAAANIPTARSHFEASIRAMQGLARPSHAAMEGLGWVLREDGDREGSRSMFEDALRLSRRSGDRAGIAYVSLGLACIAGDLGDWHRAAVLHGVAQTFFDVTGETWQVPEAVYRKTSIDQISGHLGEDEFQRSYSQGKGLSLDEAMDVALGSAHSA
jgi:predicted ATPase/class 3 adenylate cyclase